MSLKNYNFDVYDRFVEIMNKRYFEIPNQWYVYKKKHKFSNVPKDNHIMIKYGYYPDYIPIDFVYKSVILGYLP